MRILCSFFCFGCFVPDLTMSNLCLPSGVLFTADPWLISATCPSERDAAVFRFADRLSFAAGFAELHGGLRDMNRHRSMG